MSPKIALLALVFTLVFIVSVQAATDVSQPHGEPAPLAQATASPFPPIVRDSSPSQGAEQPLTAPIEVTFDQAMNQGSVEAAFSVTLLDAEETEPLAGTLTWLDDTTLRFVPSQPLQRGQRYQVAVSASAESSAGLALNRPFAITFETPGFLEIISVQPEDGASRIKLETAIVVVFSQPVVPLVAADDMEQLPQPVTFKPAVEGNGQWLNTSTYQFTPATGFAPATRYDVTISQALSSLEGATLADDFSWSFSTSAPGVIATYPVDQESYISPSSVISVAFNQLMDRRSVENAFSLRDAESGQEIAGEISWLEQGMAIAVTPPADVYVETVEYEEVGVETLRFVPDRPLDLETNYLITIDDSAMSRQAPRTKIEAAFSSQFQTVANLAVRSIYPGPGFKDAPVYTNIELTFNSPVNPDTFKLNETIFISPEISSTNVYSYFWDDDRSYSINFPSVQYSTTYTLTIKGSVESRYGQPLGEDIVTDWTTAPRQPFIYLNSPDMAGTFTTLTDTVVYVTVSGVQVTEFALYSMSEADFMKLNGENSWDVRLTYQPEPDDLIRQWQVETPVPPNRGFVYGTNLSGEAGGRLEPGLYYLEIFADPDNIDPTVARLGPVDKVKHVLIVSDYNLTLKSGQYEALAWLTNLNSATPLADVAVRVATEYDELGSSPTDASGVAVIRHERDPEIWVPRFAFSQNPFAVASSRWSEGIQRWNFDNLPVEDSYFSYNGFVYTDRPLYRPGHTVYLKGLLRLDNDAYYTLPPTDTPVSVMVYDPTGREIYRDELAVNRNGTFNGQLELAESTALGMYSIYASYPDPVRAGDQFGMSRTFQVSEFKKPEFLINVSTDKAEYLNGETIQLKAQAEYFFGGPLANAAVKYNILAADYGFKPTTPIAQGYEFTDYENSYTQRDNYFFGFGQLIAQGEGRTNSRGEFTVDVPADIAAYLMSQQFTLEVSVTDPDSNQEVSGRTSALVHKGDYYIGLKPQQYLGQSGQETAIELLTIDWQSNPAPNKSVTVVYAEHNWYSVQIQNPDNGEFYWESVVENVPVFTETITSDRQGAAISRFTPGQGGIYKITARGTDQTGSVIQSATYLWVSGDGYVNWRQQNHDRIDLITDKSEYQVGDTATILVAHPYSGTVTALLTQERGHIYSHRVFTLTSNSEQIEIPITEEMIPNMFVSVVLVSGPNQATITDTGVSADSGLTINPLPSFKLGYAALPINQKEKVIDLTLTPNGTVFQPGDEVTYDILAVDYKGEPVAGEFSLALVDKAILTLLQEEGPTLMEQFWRRRGLGVSTASGLVNSVERINLEVSPLAKGGGGGDGGQTLIELRTQFDDTTYWLADFVTNDEGVGSITVTLPDNLTTWVLTARGLSNDDRALVGDAQVEIMTSKPLLVRPVLPRFLVVGDVAEVKMVIQNNTGQSQEVRASFEVEGADFMAGSSGAGERPPASEMVTLAAAENVTLVYPVQVRSDGAGQATFRFAALAEDYQDGVELSLPVLPASFAETVATAGVLDSDGSRLEAVVLPANVEADQGQLTVQVAPSLAAGLRDSLTYLEHFAYECTEQTVSRFLPNVVTYRAYQQLNLTDPELAQRLPDLVSTGLQRLYNRQNVDGGWGWFTRDKSDPTISAYVVLGMLEAEAANFAVDDFVLENGLNYLKSSLKTPQDLVEPWQANQQAFVLYVLAEAGWEEAGRLTTLYELRDRLDYYGQAYLAMAMALVDDQDSRVPEMLNDLTRSATTSATGAFWQEQQRDARGMNTNPRSSAIIIAALSRLDPENPILPNAVRWLMSARQEGNWATTQETAWAVMGLTDWMVASGELEANYSWDVALNNAPLARSSVTQENVGETTTLAIAVKELLQDEVNYLAFNRMAATNGDDSLGNLYYSAYLEYYKPAQEVKALDRGIMVARQYSLTPPPALASVAPVQAETVIDEAKVGDIITVKLTIIAPNDLYYVLIEDPFPAGAEGVDISLNTTSVVGEAPRTSRNESDPGLGWWWFSHTELRDEKAVLFASYLPKGSYEYTYQIRASLAGTYKTLPTHAEEMYFPEVFGRGEAGTFVINE